MLTRMALGFFLLLSAMPQVSQDYPSKPVRMIEPFGAGGGPDLIARAISPKLSELWGQPVIVDNHPGAGSTVAPALVAKSPADGYTLLVNTSALAYSAALLKNLPYDPLKDFTPVAPLTSQPYVLVACKSTGITTIGELIAAAKAKPGKLKFGSAGLGTATHFGGREIQSRDSHQGSTRARRHDPSSDRRYGRRAYHLHDRAHLLRPGRYPCGQASRARCDHEETLVFAARCSDRRGGWRSWLQLSNLVWSMGACRHSCWSGRQTSEGHRARHGCAGTARLARRAWSRSNEHDTA